MIQQTSPAAESSHPNLRHGIQTSRTNAACCAEFALKSRKFLCKSHLWLGPPITHILVLCREAQAARRPGRFLSQVSITIRLGTARALKTAQMCAIRQLVLEHRRLHLCALRHSPLFQRRLDASKLAAKDWLRVLQRNGLCQVIFLARGKRYNAGVQDPVVDGLVVYDGLALPVLKLRHGLLALHDDFFDAIPEYKRLDRHGFLLANASSSANSLGLDLGVQNGVDEVDSRGSPHVETNSGL
ncbi:uncharacterized protein BDZ83DRAFT_334689 [Colletotrichum acutatum]|uniref:Uncharacterized protein n=1 Tax=Glomerella acutata TaxID=27357 RepID=A0AAD8XNK8_GLOAC|nr:uncharacterized protein BDZ83DRAFT_334689 [Colletotrichum acutatum]KAK1730772.1 hypothetical protein BDZ83DRAFT_334689 [Colletotrichum acutatum]